MKKLLLLLLIPCLLLCSCNVADGGDTSEADDITTTTDETTEEVTTEEPIDLSLRSLRTLEEYEYLLRHVTVPEEFITFDQLPYLGEYATFFTYELNNSVRSYYQSKFEMYEYGAKGQVYEDGVGDRGFRIRILHGVPPLKKENDLAPFSGSNMQFYDGSGSGEGGFWLGDIYYGYNYGILQRVIWELGDVRFELMSDIVAEFGFSRFRIDETEFDFIRDLLNAETAPAAIERFAAKLRGEEDTP